MKFGKNEFCDKTNEFNFKIKSNKLFVFLDVNATVITSSSIILKETRPHMDHSAILWRKKRKTGCLSDFRSSH